MQRADCPALDDEGVNAVLILLVTWIPLSLPLGIAVAAVLRGAFSSARRGGARRRLTLVPGAGDVEAPLGDVA